MIDYGKVTIIRRGLMKDFYKYISNMPQDVPTPPFTADVTLLSENKRDLAEDYTNAFKSAKYITLSREKKLFKSDHGHEWLDQFKFRLYGTDYSLREVRILPKEWSYSDGVIRTCFDFDNYLISLEISERKIGDVMLNLVNLN
jgi:hypothetical protein